MKQKISRITGGVAAVALYGIVGSIERFRMELGAGAAAAAVCIALMLAALWISERESDT